jgi:hypothetical protein
MARTGLRMMPTFPSPSLKFRTVSFPQYGYKASMSDEVFHVGGELKSTPDMRSTSAGYTPAFARIRAAGAAWALSPTRRARPRAAVQAAAATLPQGPLAPVRVLLSRSITAYYGPIRQSHGHATISRHCRLYAAPSLCGSASATRETFPTFAAVLSIRAIDHTPVGPRRCPVARAHRGARLPRFHSESPPTRARLCQQFLTGRTFRRCIVRFMLRPVCLPRPPDWLRADGITCVPSTLLRTLSPPRLAPAVTGGRWESG